MGIGLSAYLVAYFQEAAFSVALGCWPAFELVEFLERPSEFRIHSRSGNCSALKVGLNVIELAC